MSEKNPAQHPPCSPLRRRRFLQGGVALAASTILPRSILGNLVSAPPSETLDVAVIGTGGRGKRLTNQVLPLADARVVAIADPNEFANYERFYYKKTSGRLVAKKEIDAAYAEKQKSGAYPGLRDYVDFREMLDKEKGIDAVIIATPDHVHASASLTSIALGKHVYCEKPLARTVDEVRRVTEAARRAGVATQMGNQGNSGEGIRQICEWIWSGVLGDVTEVHAWSHTGGWAGQYTARPEDEQPVPKGLDWDLWLGPVPQRPYHIAYAPYNWRGWWQFGTGAIGDMACHNLDPAMAALKLGAPQRIEASSTEVNAETVPTASMVHFQFGARGDMPPVKLSWYDCGLYPPRPEELPAGEKFDRNGCLFIGTKGKLLSGGWGRGPRLLPASRMEEFQPPAKSLPRVESHMRAFVDAAKGGPKASSNFDYAGPLTEIVLLGNVALRSGEVVEWDSDKMQVKGSEKANALLRGEYRDGWNV